MNTIPSPREAIVQAIDATNRESATWPKNMSDAEAYGRFADSILASLARAGLTEIELAEKRIQAVRDLHRPVGLTAHTGPRIKPGGEPVPDDTSVCEYCTDPDALGWVDYPCPTVEALDGDA